MIYDSVPKIKDSPLPYNEEDGKAITKKEEWINCRTKERRKQEKVQKRRGGNRKRRTVTSRLYNDVEDAKQRLYG